MDAHEASVTGHRPIRELICPDIEEPIGQGEVQNERRRSHRYARRLPGAMIVDGIEHPVTCVDIGYAGIQVVAPDAVRVASGDHVTVKVNLGPRSFQDDFSVVQSKRTTAGTAINLGM